MIRSGSGTSASRRRADTNFALGPAHYPCGHQLPTLWSETDEPADLMFIECSSSSFVLDFYARLLSNGHVTAGLLGLLPGPVPDAG